MTKEEAIKELRVFIGQLTERCQEAIKVLIPELKENEDERIRKAIVEFFKLQDDNTTYSLIPKKSILAWLEKQKEPIGDKANRVINAARKVLNNWLYGNVDADVSGDLTELEYALKEYDGEEKQKEQKPIISAEESLGISPEEYNKIVDECIYGEQKEQKPIQSEDEKEYVRTLKGLVSDFIRDCKGGVTDIGYYQQVCDWLDGRHIEQKPAEWSEEDEYMYARIVRRYTDYEGVIMRTKEESVADKILDAMAQEEIWLKSLRPQSRKEIYQAAKHDLAIRFMNYLDKNRPEEKMSLSNGECEDIDKAFKENDWAKIMRYVEKYRPSWKPSEEQMRALWEIYQGGKAQAPIASLYEDLKKL